MATLEQVGELRRVLGNLGERLELGRRVFGDEP